MNLDLPKCMLCNKHVDKIVRLNDYHTDEYVYTVYCHDAEEEIRISKSLFLYSTNIKISAGEAFKNKQIKD